MKTTKRENKSGTVRYLHLAHNEWDPVKGRAVPRVLYSFGRDDDLDRDAIKRLVASLSRLLEPGEALASTAAGDLEYVSSVAFGGAYVLDQLWRRLRIDQIVGRVGQPKRGRRRDMTATERVLFGLVANRALAPSSKLAAAEWLSHDVHVDGLDTVDDDACYRAMDWLHEVAGDLEKQVFDEVANLLNLEVDLLFFDTTSTYFEVEDADTPVARDERGMPAATEDAPAGASGEQDCQVPGPVGFRTWGKSKDSRDDLPQIVIGMAVTRDGIPVRVWSWPGNTGDQRLIRQVKDDMRDWTLSKIVWVTDRGFSSERNRRYLRQGADAYIIGEKLRSGSDEAQAALSRQGRYAEITRNMRVKEVRVSDAERFVICHNPEAALRDEHVREQLVAQLSELIEDTDKLSEFKRGELRGKIAGKPGLNRYLRTTPTGKLRLDTARVKTEANLDGKYLLRCSDPHLSAEDIALGYKQLLEVERGWRDMKQIIDLRPVYHRREERIRAHVLLCWLALLLIRITETTTGTTWTTARRELDRLHLGTFTGPTGQFKQVTALTKPQRDLLAKLDVPVPKQIIDLKPTPR
ncbi:IS1634 family transposase [Streptomyces sp. NBC_00237]|uniref:IS1634 family transposase n=1 Tax=Streptomyces sp. NBC_00237 TaxID=2975687 RepID=UPI002257C612|nr:IS1634 family transposase [Streptomyces sp. NBC_00237]MCX5205963.1 IS1634 family transposase [Streptomyces sp. NBC_00237]MCX5206040.1 IS1634 family transposase [Streptomyces sp. NBC_00237]